MEREENESLLKVFFFNEHSECWLLFWFPFFVIALYSVWHRNLGSTIKNEYFICDNLYFIYFLPLCFFCIHCITACDNVFCVAFCKSTCIRSHFVCMLYERNRHIKWFVMCQRRECPVYCCGIPQALGILSDGTSEPPLIRVCNVISFPVFIFKLMIMFNQSHW